MRAQGLRITRYADVIEQARAYLAEHPELLDRATERVEACPGLRVFAEREERERERQWRKSARNGVLEKPTNCSVSLSGSAKSGTDIVGVFSTTSTIFRGSCLVFTS
jgi:hypothetical protein